MANQLVDLLQEMTRSRLVLEKPPELEEHTTTTYGVSVSYWLSECQIRKQEIVINYYIQTRLKDVHDSQVRRKTIIAGKKKGNT